MPRLLQSLLRHAHYEHPFFPHLLRTCRDLPSARNELRWLTEHVKSTNPPSKPKDHARKRLKRLCISRGKGKPLQYILGNQPFGDLDIKCRPGVLIPRYYHPPSPDRDCAFQTSDFRSSTETEAYTTHLAHILLQHFRTPSPSAPNPTTLWILDLCTGTGCIALLLHSLLSPQIPSLSLLGIDISPRAIALAKYNLHSNIRGGHLPSLAATQVQSSQADIFREDAIPEGKWDVLVANPPYISPSGYDRNTSRSVRAWEPQTALVPPLPHPPSSPPPSQPLTYTNTECEKDNNVGDAFYPRLFNIAQRVDAQVVLVEVADLAQAQRVAALAIKAHVWRRCEIWRDWPAGRGVQAVEIEGRRVEVRGEGEGRAVMLRK